MPTRQLLVTAALPYVNGHIHIGHLVEYIQADIWVRFQRLRGHRVAFICADDTHGTATMIRARQEGRSEQAIIAEMNAAHQRDFADFGVAFSHYGSTDSPSNQRLVGEIWAALRAARDADGAPIVTERDVTQLYDPQAGCFLADRFVKGSCPVCKSPDQYGDSCEKCASTFSPTDLIDPVSTLSGAKPELRSAKHCFVRLEPFRDFLKEWTRSTAGAGRTTLQPEMANWLHGAFLKDELRDWDVSRPAPYFGFEIPDAPGNYFYVWVDAPVGYLASLSDGIAAGAVAGPLARWWPKRGEPGYDSPDIEVHHFIGKDITYFHTLFWPAMLKAAAYKLPTQVHIHGFLTVDGEKMSKSKGTFIKARTYLEAGLDPTYLRYYFASKLNDHVSDIDLNLGEFKAKVDSDLVGKVVNLASRTAKFVEAGGLASFDELAARVGHQTAHELKFDAAFAANEPRIAAAYEARDYAEATRLIMELADLANAFVAEVEPWTMAKDPAKAVELRVVCTIALDAFRLICLFLAPIAPQLRERAEQLLGMALDHWESAKGVLGGRPIAAFTHMFPRVDVVKVQAMVDASKVESPPPAAPAAVAATVSATAATSVTAARGPDDDAALKAEPLAATVSFEDFAKLDLRVGRVIAAEEVPKAKKILKLTLSLGGEERRTIFAGIKTAYADPAPLVGRLIVFVANLAPRQMSFGTSEGMALAAGPGGQEIFLLAPDSGAKPGQRVH